MVCRSRLLPKKAACNPKPAYTHTSKSLPGFLPTLCTAYSLWSPPPGFDLYVFPRGSFMEISYKGKPWTLVHAFQKLVVVLILSVENSYPLMHWDSQPCNRYYRHTLLGLAMPHHTSLPHPTTALFVGQLFCANLPSRRGGDGLKSAS